MELIRSVAKVNRKKKQAKGREEERKRAIKKCFMDNKAIGTTRVWVAYHLN